MYVFISHWWKVILQVHPLHQVSIFCETFYAMILAILLPYNTMVQLEYVFSCPPHFNLWLSCSDECEGTTLEAWLGDKEPILLFKRLRPSIQSSTQGSTHLALLRCFYILRFSYFHPVRSLNLSNHPFIIMRGERSTSFFSNQTDATLWFVYKKGRIPSRINIVSMSYYWILNVCVMHFGSSNPTILRIIVFRHYVWSVLIK